MKSQEELFKIANELEDFFDNMNCHCPEGECCGLPKNECKLEAIAKVIHQIEG